MNYIKAEENSSEMDDSLPESTFHREDATDADSFAPSVEGPSFSRISNHSDSDEDSEVDLEIEYAGVDDEDRQSSSSSSESSSSSDESVESSTSALLADALLESESELTESQRNEDSDVIGKSFADTNRMRNMKKVEYDDDELGLSFADTARARNTLSSASTSLVASDVANSDILGTGVLPATSTVDKAIIGNDTLEGSQESESSEALDSDSSTEVSLQDDDGDDISLDEGENEDDSEDIVTSVDKVPQSHEEASRISDEIMSANDSEGSSEAHIGGDPLAEIRTERDVYDDPSHPPGSKNDWSEVKYNQHQQKAAQDYDIVGSQQNHQVLLHPGMAGPSPPMQMQPHQYSQYNQLSTNRSPKDLYSHYSKSSNDIDLSHPNDDAIYESDVEHEDHDGYGSDDDRIGPAVSREHKKVKGRANRRASYSDGTNRSFGGTAMPVMYNAYGHMGPAAILVAGPVAPNSSQWTMNQHPANQQLMHQPNQLPPGSHLAPLSHEQHNQQQQQLHFRDKQRHRGILKTTQDSPQNEVALQSMEGTTEDHGGVIYPGDPSDDEAKNQTPAVAVSSVNLAPSSPRRGRRRSALNGGEAANASEEPQPQKGLRTRRGVTRQATGDSFEMHMMAASVSRVDTTAPHQRTGNTTESVPLKDNTAESDQPKGMRTRRGVVRQPTGDSIEMNLMAASASRASNVETNQPRRGGRRQANNPQTSVTNMDPSDEMANTSEPRLAGGIDSAGDQDATAQSPKGLRTRRGVVRQATGDSLEMSIMAASASASSLASPNQPRRGGRRRKSDFEKEKTYVGGPPIAADDLTSTTEDMDFEMQSMDGSAGNGLDSSAGKGLDASSESHKGLRTRRGVVRQATGDSLEMSLMAASASAAQSQPNKGRRGGRRRGNDTANSDDPPSDAVVASEFKAENADSVEARPLGGSASTGLDSSEANKGLRTRRGVVRQATGDSLEMSLMAASAQAASVAAPNQPRRGGRRRKNDVDDDNGDINAPASTPMESDENREAQALDDIASKGDEALHEAQKGLRTRRGVVRQATGDSLEMSLMAASAANVTASPGKQRRGGRRKTNDVTLNAADVGALPLASEEAHSILEIAGNDKIEGTAGNADSAESHQGLRTRRGVVRQATGDSLEMSLMAASAAAASQSPPGRPRRGGRRQSTVVANSSLDADAALNSSKPHIIDKENDLVSSPNAQRDAAAESPKGLRTRRGVVRQATGDSLEMSIMAASASAASQASPNQPRRGGRRRKNDTGTESEFVSAPPMTHDDTKAREEMDGSNFESQSMDSSAGKGMDGSSETHKGLRTRRGVVRQATGDSLEMSLMAASAAAANAPTSGARRGGRRQSKAVAAVEADNSVDSNISVEIQVETNEDVQTKSLENSASKGLDSTSETHKGMRTRRGVVRQATGDSLEMSLMAASAATSMSNDKPRRGGRRNSAFVAEDSRNAGELQAKAELPPSMEQGSGDHIDRNAKEANQNVDTHKGVRTRRGVVRQATGDSLEMSLMAASVGAQSSTDNAASSEATRARRGGRRSAGFGNPKMEDADEVESKEEAAPVEKAQGPRRRVVDRKPTGDLSDFALPAPTNAGRRGGRRNRNCDDQDPSSSVEQVDETIESANHEVPDSKKVLNSDEDIMASQKSISSDGLPSASGAVQDDRNTIDSQPSASRSPFLSDDPRGMHSMMNTAGGVGSMAGSHGPPFHLIQHALPPQYDQNEYEYGALPTLSQFGYFPGAYIVANPQGYGAAYIQQLPMQHVMQPMQLHRPQRRFSNASTSSRASQRSRRRHSLVLPMPSEAPPLLAHPRAKPDSDSDSSDSDDHPSKVMGIMVPRQMYNFKKEQHDADRQSDAESSYSMSSSKRATRRNSCLENGVSDPFYSSGHYSVARATTRESDSENDDDPNSLFNRAKMGAAMKNVHKFQKSVGAELNIEQSNLGIKSLLPNEAKADVFETNVATTSKTDIKKQEVWRSEPLTTPYLAPTLENLKENLDIPTDTIRGNWGDMQFKLESKSTGPLSASSSSYGERIYSDDNVAPEIDNYRQRARRRFSLENTCIDMEILATENTTGSKLPDFRPAEGCRNASDYIIRSFSARLRTTGLTVLKHHRSRWSKSQYRVFYLLPDGKTLTWKVAEGEKDKGRGKAKRPEIDLSKCKEIRHAWTKDPDTKKKTGTAVLRARCKEDDAARSFSLIFSKRTLDVTAFSMDQCKIMMEGFSALCFRLQLDQKKEPTKEAEDDDSQHAVLKETASEDDWASTIYGVDSVVPSLNSGDKQNQDQPLAAVPWGF